MTNTAMPRSPTRLLTLTRSVAAKRCLLLVVEGVNDVEFLRRISRMLRRSDASLPNLEELERHGRIVFLPFGGGNVAAWATRLQPLGCRELHLYDREAGAETHYRVATAKRVNARPNCRAFVMAKRSLENYLHPTALKKATGIDMQFGDHDAVAELVAEQRWLNTSVVDTMTPELLSERDHYGEVMTWLQAVAEMTR